MITILAESQVYFVAYDSAKTIIHAGIVQQGHQVSTGLFELDCYDTEAELLVDHPYAFDLLHTPEEVAT
jgi:hypothetical protein